MANSLASYANKILHIAHTVKRRDTGFLRDRELHWTTITATMDPLRHNHCPRRLHQLFTRLETIIHPPILRYIVE